MFDYHIHTHHSFDGFHSMEELTKRAISLGLQKICFTDHKDYDYDGEGNDFTFSYESFFEEINEIAHKYRKEITVLSGVEFGLQPFVNEKYIQDAASHPFDFIIGSLHSVHKTDIFTGDYFESRSQQEAYHDYFNDMLQVIQNDTPFSVLGHMDMIKRYGGYSETLPLNDYQEVATVIFKELIERGKGIEVNTSGFRYGLEDTHPSFDLLKLYYEVGGEIIVPGSDTHRIDELAFRFRETFKVLHSIGYRFIASYSNMEPAFHRIEKYL